MFHRQQIAVQAMDISNTILLLVAQQIVKTVQLLHHAIHATPDINYIQMHAIVLVPQEHTNLAVIVKNVQMDVNNVRVQTHAVNAVKVIIYWMDNATNHVLMDIINQKMVNATNALEIAQYVQVRMYAMFVMMISI